MPQRNRQRRRKADRKMIEKIQHRRQCHSRKPSDMPAAPKPLIAVKAKQGKKQCVGIIASLPGVENHQRRQRDNRQRNQPQARAVGKMQLQKHPKQNGRQKAEQRMRESDSQFVVAENKNSGGGSQRRPRRIGDHAQVVVDAEKFVGLAHAKKQVAPVPAGNVAVVNNGARHQGVGAFVVPEAGVVQIDKSEIRRQRENGGGDKADAPLFARPPPCAQKPRALSARLRHNRPL